MAEASVSVRGDSGVNADASVGGGGADVSASIGGSRSGGTSPGDGDGGGSGTGGGTDTNVAGNSGSTGSAGTTTGKRTGTTVANSGVTLADLYVGREVMTRDRMVVGRVAEIRANSTACPTLGVAPSHSLEAGVDRLWFTLGSCRRSANAAKPIRLSITSGALMRQIF